MIERDDIHAFHEQWKDVENRYNPEIVRLRREKPIAGTLAHIVFEMDLSKVKHPRSGLPSKFFVHKANELLLFRTDHLWGEIVILPNFPISRPKVRFLNNQIPQHINVFRSGAMCIGSSDVTVLYIMLDNIFRACIYDTDPSVANYESAADPTAKDWQKQKEITKEFPIMNPSFLFRQTKTALPSIRRVIIPYNNTGLDPIRR